jgi:exonuclease VII small subunit
MSFNAECNTLLARVENKIDELRKECLDRLDKLEKRTESLEEAVKLFSNTTEKNMKCSAVIDNVNDDTDLHCSETLPDSKRSKKMFFFVQKVKNASGVLSEFNVSGSVDEIQKDLENFGVSFWNEFNHRWDFYYESGLYDRVVAFLKSISDDVIEI